MDPSELDISITCVEPEKKLLHNKGFRTEVTDQTTRQNFTGSEIGREIGRDILADYIKHDVERAKIPLVRCWVCIMRKYYTLVNDEHWYETPLVESNIPDYSICRHCYPMLLELYKNPPTEQALGAIYFMKSFKTGEAITENCTFRYIQDWKLHNIFSLRLFIAMCEWSITAPMLESFSLTQLKEYACRLITEDHSRWHFFKELNSNAPAHEKLYLLSQKDVSELHVTAESFDPNVILTHEGLTIISNQPPVTKALTAHFQKYFKYKH